MAAARPAKATATPPRTETLEAPLVAVLVAAVPVAVRETEAESVPLPLVVALAVVGVNGAVTPNPGSSELGTLAAKAANVFAPVVGGLIAPYMPPLQ